MAATAATTTAAVTATTTAKGRAAWAALPADVLAHHGLPWLDARSLAR
jgi:hypothetical protein